MRIDCQQAHKLLRHGAQLLDVRSPYEFAEQAAPGAQNIPLHLLEKYHPLLDRRKPVVVYCRSGNRSAMASELLRRAGFKAVHDLGSLRNFYSCQ